MELSFLIAAMALCLTPLIAKANQEPRPVTPGPPSVPSERPQSNTTQPPQQPEKPKKPPFTLRVTEDHILGISLRARNARLSEIAAELSRKVHAPVALSRVMENQMTTVNFSDLLLEPAMQLLAPVVYIDYEIDSAPGAQPRPMGIFLNAHNEPPPATNAVVRSKSQIMVIEGNTEDNGEDSEEEPVQISYKAGRLTVKAKDQPAIDVLARIASEVGVPFEAGEDSTETVTVNIQDLPLAEAILRVSPNLLLYVRANLFRGERTPLRIVLVERDKKVVE